MLNENKAASKIFQSPLNTPFKFVLSVFTFNLNIIFFLSSNRKNAKHLQIPEVGFRSKGVVSYISKNIITTPASNYKTKDAFSTLKLKIYLVQNLNVKTFK